MNVSDLTSPTTHAAADALTISQAISCIYHYTQGETTPDFGHHALSQLVKLIDVDSACWLVLSHNQPATITTKFHYGLTKNDLCKFDAVLINELLQQTKITSGDCMIVPQDKRPNQDNNQNQGQQPYRINQQMLALNHHDKTQHLFILNRQDQSKTFSETQLSILGFMVPLLTNAIHQNIENKLTRHWNYWRSHKAICDQHGFIIATQQGFVTTLAQNLADWDQQRLPTQFEQSQLPLKLEYGKIKVEVFADDDLIVAEAYHFDHLIESLTPAETKIAELLLQAKTNKEMAQTLEVKEKTIEHQLKSLCTKLNASNRTEAMMILQTSDYRFNLDSSV